MYGYLTMEQCYQLSELGYSIICDADNHDTYIRDSEKEYIVDKIPAALDYFQKLFDNLTKSFKGIFKTLGETFLKLSE